MNSKETAESPDVQNAMKNTPPIVWELLTELLKENSRLRGEMENLKKNLIVNPIVNFITPDNGRTQGQQPSEGKPSA